MLPLETLLRHRYRLEARLGQGGMGAVYRAIDLHTGQQVAIKQLRGDLPLLRAAFEREAELLRRLRHPSLPRVSDAFVDDEQHFLVMTFVPGLDLGEQLNRQTVPFPLAAVLDWAAQLLDVLAYLHARRPPIVHRDIKPRNLKLDADGHVVLLDFGLARPAEASTLAGYTLAYAPLEQVRGDELEARSDLYALGVTLYELLARRLPPDALTRAATLADHQPDPLPPLHTLNRTVPPAVSALIGQVIALQPGERPSTARAMRTALADARARPPTDAGPSVTLPAAAAPADSAPHGWPSGTITLLALDGAALVKSADLLRRAVTAQHGVIVEGSPTGCLAAFGTADAALASALAAYRRLRDTAASTAQEPVGVRIALMTGAATLLDGAYAGPAVPRVRRLLEIAHAEQILLGMVTAELLRDRLPPGVGLRDLGTHRLRGLSYPERLYQLTAADVPIAFPPLAAPEVRAASLPDATAPLVGRTSELAALGARLRHATVRLLTVTGPGGVGKTRLAIQAAEALIDDVADGAYFVALSAIRDPALVVDAIGSALGVREQGARSMREAVIAELRTRETLLILDNFEQVIGAAALVADLVGATRGKVIVTSRTRLELATEDVYEVPALDPPEAVALFVQCARSVQPDLVLDAAATSVVARLCARLDHLPLAIELAAARISLFPPAVLLTRLEADRRLASLAVGLPHRPARQQTLRAALAWSYELLGPDAQRIFARLGAFDGGADIEAAEAVCASIEDTGLAVPAGLAELATASLLRAVPSDSGALRYEQLETVREYAAERLSRAADERVVRERHADYFLHLADAADAQMGGPRMGAWLQRLRLEQPNLRAGLHVQLASVTGAAALHLAGALWRFWLVQGHLTEGRHWLDQALSRAEASTSAILARALVGAGVLAWHQQDVPTARARLQAAVEVATAADEPAQLATALKHLGLIALKAEPIDPLAARQHFEAGLALRRAQHDADGTASCLNDLAVLALEQADYPRARDLLEESLTICRASGNPYGPSFVLNNLSLVALAQGDYAAAARWLQEGLGLARELGNPEGIGCALCGLASLAAARGAGSTAARLFGAAQALQDSVGITLSPAERTTYGRHLRLAQEQLDVEAWAGATAAGRADPLDETLRVALAELGLL